MTAAKCVSRIPKKGNSVNSKIFGNLIQKELRGLRPTLMTPPAPTIGGDKQQRARTVATRRARGAGVHLVVNGSGLRLLPVTIKEKR